MLKWGDDAVCAQLQLCACYSRAQRGALKCKHSATMRSRHVKGWLVARNSVLNYCFLY